MSKCCGHCDDTGITAIAGHGSDIKVSASVREGLTHSAVSLIQWIAHCQTGVASWIKAKIVGFCKVNQTHTLSIAVHSVQNTDIIVCDQSTVCIVHCHFGNVRVACGIENTSHANER